MKNSLFSYWDLCYYCGQLWRVIGPAPEGRLMVRRCGHEYGWGLWGSDGYGRPILVQAEAKPGGGMLWLA
jgi:hypothetical protein